jgi:hypothetical protein
MNSCVDTQTCTPLSRKLSHVLHYACLFRELDVKNSVIRASSHSLHCNIFVEDYVMYNLTQWSMSTEEAKVYPTQKYLPNYTASRPRRQLASGLQWSYNTFIDTRLHDCNYFTNICTIISLLYTPRLHVSTYLVIIRAFKIIKVSKICLKYLQYINSC